MLLSNLVENAWRAPRPRPRHADQPDPDAADSEARRLRPRPVLPTRRAHGTRIQAELVTRLATVRRLGRGRSARCPELLFTAQGKPRCAVVYLAHLSEAERQFVVTLVFAKLVTWMRGQAGTPDLRALAYMDEVFGYVPPTASPPSKKPMLTIFKQGRAFGVGLVLSTQNPVDLDYKAMSNAATWLVGRLRPRTTRLECSRGSAQPRRHGRRGARRGDRRARQAPVSPRLREVVAAAAFRHSLGDVVPARPTDEGTGRKARPGRADCARRRTRRRGTPRCRAAASSRRRDHRRADGRYRRRRRVSRSVRAVGAEVGAVPVATRQRAFLTASVSLRFDDSAAGVDEQQEFEAMYGPLAGGLDLESERQVDYDERDFGTEAPLPTYVLPGARRRGVVLHGAAREIQRRLVDQRALELQRNRRSSSPPVPASQRRSSASAATQKGRPGPTPRRPRSANGSKSEARSARAGALAGAASSRGARRRRAVASGDRAGRRRRRGAGALFGGRRSTRSITSAIGGAASRRGVKARRSSDERRRRRGWARTDDLAALEQEILDEVAEIDEQWPVIAAESTRSRSGSRRPTSAWSRRGSCRCRATDADGGRARRARARRSRLHVGRSRAAAGRDRRRGGRRRPRGRRRHADARRRADRPGSSRSTRPS